MIIVSGCPRSGTSLMMKSLRYALGEKRMFGQQFPLEDRLTSARQRKPNETDEVYAWRMYLADKQLPVMKNRGIRAKELNPEGFWENEFTTSGLSYRVNLASQFKRMLSKVDGRPYFAKIVSQGLAKTDPIYVDKVIYMVRDPSAVATSQERLIREAKFRTETNQVVDLLPDGSIHSPTMFINSAVWAAKWFTANPDISVLIVDYDELTSHPREQFARIREFLGEGDFAEAAALIDPALKRSKPREETGPEWQQAYRIFESLKKGDFAEILPIVFEEGSEIIRRTQKWYCPRAGMQMIRPHCESCYNDPNFRESIKKQAERQEIDWKKEPCAYECVFGDDTIRKTIEHSIADNFWNRPLPQASPQPITVNGKPCPTCKRSKKHQ